MISVDTNVLIRIITQDDSVQYKKAYRLFEDSEIFISKTALLETEWVLRSNYSYESDRIYHAFKVILGLKNIIVEDAALSYLCIKKPRERLRFCRQHELSFKHCIRRICNI